MSINAREICILYFLIGLVIPHGNLSLKGNVIPSLSRQQTLSWDTFRGCLANERGAHLNQRCQGLLSISLSSSPLTSKATGLDQLCDMYGLRQHVPLEIWTEMKIPTAYFERCTFLCFFPHPTISQPSCLSDTQVELMYVEMTILYNQTPSHDSSPTHIETSWSFISLVCSPRASMLAQLSRATAFASTYWW